LVGWRRDNWGALDDYIKWYTEQNTLTVNGMRLDTAIMNRWKYAPIVGEPNNGGVYYNGCDYGDLENQVRKYHAVSFGNGNMFSLSSACGKNNVRAASKAAGYRMLLTGGNISSSSIATGSSFRISLDWKNAGISPTYENWNVIYQLKNSSGAVVWTGNSGFKLK